MRHGGGKAKGSGFERQICKALSLWVTNGKNEDCFWRSAMSGGRATVHHRKGTKIRQAGDITAVSPEGHKLLDVFFIECKHVKNLSITSFLLSNTGPLAQFWHVAKKQAKDHGRHPMLIAKANNRPIIVVTSHGDLEFEYHTAPQITAHTHGCDISLFEDMILTEYV